MGVIKQFPFNPVIDYLEYNGASMELSIHFKKGETRIYAEVPKETFYGCLYLQTIKELMTYYHAHLRKKFKLLTITK